MATPIFYTGDTWPPLQGTVKDATGTAVNIAGADALRLVAKCASPSDVIAGTADVRSVPLGGAGDGSDGKWEYTWAADDLTVVGDYIPEIEVTWDSGASPPTVETFRTDTEKFTVKADND